jgi:hypothetical protein
VSMPPAVKLAAAEHAGPALDPDIIAAEWSEGMSDIEGKVTRVGARERGRRTKFQIVEDLQAALAQFAEIAADLKR